MVMDMKLGTTYICVTSMEKSLRFYKNLLEEEPFICNEDRWISFSCGISLYNRSYDERLIREEKKIHFNQAHLEEFNKNHGSRKNNIVIFNFQVENLKAEYERLKQLGIGEMSDILFVNIHMPYYYFNITDPDGNILEITGNYEQGENA